MARRYSNKNRKSSPFAKSGGSTESIDSFGSIDRLDKFGSSSSLSKLEQGSEDDGVHVVVRIRPLNSREMKGHDQNVVTLPGNGQILLEGLSLISSTNGIKSKLFSFNVVFEPKATQSDVFNFCGIKRLIGMAIEGFNTTCFCYGQTGSGKTHTLTGPPNLFLRKKMDPYSSEHGLVYRSFLHLFQQLRDHTDRHFVLKASFLEIYNEKVIDLLNPGSTQKPLSVRWSKKSRNFFVENLFTVDCEELDDLQAVLEEGMKNRTVSSHTMNDYSGRSHTILTVHITSEKQMPDSEVFITKHGKINFVDLAGSEMTKKTNSSGKTLKEANNINKSLMVLGQNENCDIAFTATERQCSGCNSHTIPLVKNLEHLNTTGYAISNLSSSECGYCISSLSDPRKRNGHIPYRDSKLTKLLADSLAGNGVTLMIACISPALSNACETLNTLRYAARAKRIRTKPIIVMDPRESLIVALKREVEALKKENDRLRVALDLNKSYMENMKKSSEMYEKFKNTPLNMEKLAQMDSIELVDLIKHYAVENEALRKENSDLFHSRDVLIRDHELVCRENERLIKKIEASNTLSPTVSTRASFSADGELSSSHMESRSALHSSRLNSARTIIKSSSLPDTIRKELNKKEIGKTIPNVVDTFKNRRSSEKTQQNEPKMNGKSVTASMLYEIFGSPVYHRNNRETITENTAFNRAIEDGTDEIWSASTMGRNDFHLPRIVHNLKLFRKNKRFRSPFGSPISSAV